MTLRITYKDSAGLVTERDISNWVVSGSQQIDAYCHLRNSERPFYLDKILCVVDVETGEIVTDLYNYFGCCYPSEKEGIDATVSTILISLKILKLFSKSVRGFSIRERGRIIDYMFLQTDLDSYSREEIDSWLYKLWPGQKDEYTYLLNWLPKLQKIQCRDVAIEIARGSGRKPIDNDILQRINTEFS